MKYLLPTILLLQACFTLPALANPFNESVLKSKGAQWLSQNLSRRKVKPRLTQPRVYGKDELFLKVLSILETEKAFGFHASNGIHSLIYNEYDLVMAHRSKVENLIEVLEMSQEEKNYLHSLLGSRHLSSPHRAVKTSASETVSIPEALKLARSGIADLKVSPEAKESMTGAVDTVEKILINSIPEDSCYNYDPECQFSSNLGLIYYFSSRIHENHELALATLRMGLRVQHLNLKYRDLLFQGPLHHQKFKINIWPMLLEVSGGDPTLAMEVLSVYGHDVVSNNLIPGSENTFLTDILNEFMPSNQGTDQNPASIIYIPGALKNLHPSSSSIAKVTQTLRTYNQLHGTKETYRNGYYHVYGGILMANELLSAGFGQIGIVDQASLISQMMGYAYKKLQIVRYLSEDALKLWHNIDENEFKLRNLRKPGGWSETRYLKAKSLLEFNLAVMEFTEEQHRVGARFAIEIYKNLK